MNKNLENWKICKKFESGRLYSRSSFKTKEFKAENLQPTSTDYVIITISGE